MMQNLYYYKRLVTSEYRHSPRFTAMVQKLLSYGLDIDNSINNMLLAFEMDNASTAQLDILGQIVGVGRQLKFEPSAAAIGEVICPSPAEMASGEVYPIIYTPTPDKLESTPMLTGYPPAEMGEGNLLDDEVFRLMIKARIIQNTWKGTIGELYDLWDTVMGAEKKLSIEDLQDMSYNIVLQGDYTQLEEELIIHAYVIPKPEGVRINVLTFVSTDGLPLFSYDYNTMRYSGYESHWAEAEKGN
jgi:hypothetical protein